MADQAFDPSPDLAPRDPVPGDLAALARELNAQGARYLICGGFAIIAAGYPRHTSDIDLLIDSSRENEAKVFRALESLPDQAVLLLDPGDVKKYTVVRVADEIVIDLMASASGLGYEQAASEVTVHTIEGVPIPFASPRLLWRMKSRTHREKDQADLVFLRELFKNRGEAPPEAA